MDPSHTNLVHFFSFSGLEGLGTLAGLLGLTLTGLGLGVRTGLDTVGDFMLLWAV